MNMMSDYEKNYLDSITRGPDSINIKPEMTKAQEAIEIIRYIKQAIRNQPVSCGLDLDRCDAFLDSLKYEYEIEDAWLTHEKENK